MAKTNKTEDIGIDDILSFIKRNIFVALLFMFATTVLTSVQFARSPSFTATGFIRLEDSRSNTLQAVTEKITGLGTYQQYEKDQIMESYILLMSSREFSNQVAKSMIQHGVDQRYQKLILGKNSELDKTGLSELILDTVELSRHNADTFRLSLTLSKGDDAVEALNILVDNVVYSFSERESQNLSSAKKFLEKQIAEIQEEVNIIDESIAERISNSKSKDYKLGAIFSDSPSEIAKMESDLIDLQQDLEETNEELEKTKRAPAEASSPIDKYGDVARLSYLEKKAEALKLKIKSGKKILREIVSVDSTKPLLQKELEALYKQREVQYQLFSDLKREVLSLDIQKISSNNKVKILERPVPGSARATKNLASTVIKRSIFAAIVAYLLAFGIEFMNPVVRSRKDLMGFPLAYLGSIPNLDRRRGRGFLKTMFYSIFRYRRRRSNKSFTHTLELLPDSFEDIIFKNLRARVLNFKVTTDRSPQVVSVMSAGAGEGKTSICSNLAKSIAMSGKRVLLIDADLRRRSLTIAQGLQVESGLSDYLAKPNNESEKTIVKKLYDNLDILPAGQLSNESTELISSKHFKEVVEAMKHFYDIILIDSPPALPYSEVIQIAKLSDLVIFSVRSKKTQLDAFDQVMEKLQFSTSTRFGFVMNCHEEGKLAESYPDYFKRARMIS
ncbi:MAG: AAA family ATPase [Oligoflexia bacterium]|nr:AAA family ATPase [Oligoflexia bacterium]